MQMDYFYNYNQLPGIPRVGHVAGIINTDNYYNLRKLTKFSERNYESVLQRLAGMTGDWHYYERLLVFRSNQMELQSLRNSIIEKYPYDGKSSFAQLLASNIPANKTVEIQKTGESLSSKQIIDNQYNRLLRISENPS